MDRYDVLVIGAGHNGLVTAAELARVDLRVAVFEQRSIIGGACITEELIPGARFSTAAFVVSSLHPTVIDKLELARFGLELYETDVINFVMAPSGEHLFLWRDQQRMIHEIERLNEHDARSLVALNARFRQFAELLEPFWLGDPPALSAVIRRFEEAAAIDLWHEFVTVSIGDLVDRYFEHELLKGLFTFFALVSAHAGPYTPGTAYEFSHHCLVQYRNGLGGFRFARGGMGAITQALGRAARYFGAEIYTGIAVDRILIREGRVIGVRLHDGSVVHANTVVSNADPRRTYLTLINPEDLPEEIRKRACNIDVRGSMGRVHLLVDQLPQYLGLPPGEGPQHCGLALLGGTLTSYQRAWEAQLRGELIDGYPIELVIQSVSDPTLAPPGLHTVTLGVQQLPWKLAQGDWETQKEEFTNRVLQSLFHFAPNLQGAIRGQVTLTPLDWEREYNLTGGNIFHGAMFTNQLFVSRPAPGLGGCRTPIKGLYLCSAGVHPGGAVTGVPGLNAARTVLADRTTWDARPPP